MHLEDMLIHKFNKVLSKNFITNYKYMLFKGADAFMTLQQLSYFVEIAKYGSINKAAHSLYVTQPCLSNAIKSLEEEFHLQLIERGKRGIQFTSDGRIFLNYATQLLAQAQDFENKFVPEKQTKRVQFSFSMQHYQPAVKAFIEFILNINETKYELHLKETTNFEAIEDVYKKRSNVGMIFISENNREFITKILKNRNILYEEIYMAKPHIFINSGHPLVGKAYVTAEDLAEFPRLYFEKDFENYLDYSDEMFRIENQDKIIYSSDRGSVNAILANTNCYMMGTGVIISSISNEKIVSIPMHGNTQPIHLGLIRFPSIEHQNETEEFINLLKLGFSEV